MAGDAYAFVAVAGAAALVALWAVWRERQMSPAAQATSDELGLSRKLRLQQAYDRFQARATQPERQAVFRARDPMRAVVAWDEAREVREKQLQDEEHDLRHRIGVAAETNLAFSRTAFVPQTPVAGGRD